MKISHIYDSEWYLAPAISRSKSCESMLTSPCNTMLRSYDGKQTGKAWSGFHDKWENDKSGRPRRFTARAAQKEEIFEKDKLKHGNYSAERHNPLIGDHQQWFWTSQPRPSNPCPGIGSPVDLPKPAAISASSKQPKIATGSNNPKPATCPDSGNPKLAPCPESVKPQTAPCPDSVKPRTEAIPRLIPSHYYYSDADYLRHTAHWMDIQSRLQIWQKV